MIYISKNIRYLRKKNKYSKERLGELTNRSISTIQMWETGMRTPTMSKATEIAKIFNIDINTLLYLDLQSENYNSVLKLAERRDFLYDTSSSIRIPVLGSIDSATSFIEMGNIVDWEEISSELVKGNRRYFALEVTDDTMEPEYCINDIVIFLKTSEFSNGDDCIVTINENVSFFRRLTKQENGVLLQAINAKYKTEFYIKEEVDKLPITINGVAKEIRRTVKK